MSLRDREYMNRPEGDDGERPPKPKVWILAVAVAIVLIFLLSLWPRH